MDIKWDSILLSVELTCIVRCCDKVIDREVVCLEIIIQSKKLSARNVVQKVALVTYDHVRCVSCCESGGELGVVVIKLDGVVLKLDVSVGLVELIDDCIEEFSVSTGEQRPEGYDSWTGLGLSCGLCEQCGHAEKGDK